MNQLIEVQKTWFENASQQNALHIRTVNTLTETRQDASTEAQSEWIKQGIENFVEAQKRWLEIAVRQGEQILQTVQSNSGFSGYEQKSTAKIAEQNVESLVKMCAAWLDFVTARTTV